MLFNSRESLAAIIFGAVVLLTGCATPQPALYHAVQEDNMETVRGLLAQGSDANQPYVKATPLLQAVHDHNLPMARLLLGHGADPNKIGFLDWTGVDNAYISKPPLAYAALITDTDMCNLLLDNGADPAVAVSALRRLLDVQTPGGH